MGQPVKIIDLAKQMIELSGFRVGDDIEIKFTGLKPGEKLFEELQHHTEEYAPTAHPPDHAVSQRSQGGSGGGGGAGTTLTRDGFESAEAGVEALRAGIFAVSGLRGRESVKVGRWNGAKVGPRKIGKA